MLHPISFKTSEDIVQFLLLIRANTTSIVQAEGGELYLTEDINKYLSEASDGEVEACMLTIQEWRRYFSKFNPD